MSFLGDLLGSVVSVAGDAIKAPIQYFYNKKLQNNQSDNNAALQEQAYNLNEQAADNAMARTQQLNKELWNREDVVNAKSTQVAVNGMRSAGLNVNAALGGGFSPAVSNQQSTQAGPQGSAPGASVGLANVDVPSMSSLMMNLAQTDFIKKQTERLQIENDRLKDEDQWFAEHSGNYYIDDNGNRIDSDQATKLVDEGKEVSLVLAPNYKSYGSFKAAGDLIERNVRKVTSRGDKLASEYQQSILRMQNVDEDAKKVIAAMPANVAKHAIEQLGILVSEGKIKKTNEGLAVTQSAIANLEKQLLDMDVQDSNNSRWSQLVQNYKKGDFGSALITALGLFLSKLSISSRIR